MSTPIKVLIIEDDFRVAEINREFVERVPGFQVSCIAKTGREALAFLENNPPDLILMDIFIPDVNGLELLWKIRENYKDVDVIMITAAKEAHLIGETLRGGIMDYIIKPVDFNRLKETLERYKLNKRLLVEKTEMEQQEVDHLLGFSYPLQETANGAAIHQKAAAVPKGIDPLTLRKVLSHLEHEEEVGLTAVELGKKIGVSRTTSRRYLEYLVSIYKVKAKLNYGEVGRPERRYYLNS